MTKKIKPIAFSHEEKAIIQNYYPKYGAEKTRIALRNAGFKRTALSVKMVAYRNGIKREVPTVFSKGHTPFNKGKRLPDAVRQKIARTQFKPGHKNTTQCAIGTINTWGGYLYIKIADPQEWKLYHHFVWEQHNGAIPTGHVLVFNDGNPNNADIQNLVLLTRKQHAQRNAARVSASDRKASRIKAVQTRKENDAARRRKELREKYGSIYSALLMGEKL